VHHIPKSNKNHNNNKRKSTCLPPETVEYLKAWMMSPAHIAHPYPTEQEKLEIMADTGIELKQLTNWFVNNRKRFWKPQVEGKQHLLLPKTDSVAAVKSKDVIMTSTAEPVSPTLRGMVAKHPSSFCFPTTRTVSQVSLVDEEMNTTASRPSIVSPPRNGTISELSSEDEEESCCASTTEQDDLLLPSVTTSTQEQDPNSITVYILRPHLGDTPTLHDVVTDSDGAVLDQDVLAQYDSIQVSCEASCTSAQERRALYQAEVDRIKRQQLQVYLQSQVAAVSAPAVISKRSRSFDFSQQDAVDTPRPKYRRVSIDLWKEACLSARNGYDSSLPSLEEAASLFGYAEV
jgi:hypothetical protein